MSRRILFLSSADPLHGPGRLMLDIYEAMKRGGYEVDFYTQYSVPGYPDIHALCGEGPSLRVRIRNYVFLRMQKPAYYFFYCREERPPVPTSHILKQINGHYDLIYIGFWQGLLSFDSVSRIHDKFKAPVALACVDCSVMTGGCHYPHECDRYKKNCGHCPGLKKLIPDTFTKHNVSFRTAFYDRIDPFILCNSYTEKVFQGSSLLRNRRFVRGYPIIDESLFCPRDKASLRKKYGVDVEHRFILLAGAQHFKEDRKGGRYLVEALNLFYEQLTVEERKKVLLLIVGHPSSEMEQIHCERRSLGYVNFETLAELYALSDLFLSPSIEDAGPMMVNQAISCGTPVVSFLIGTALDVVEGKGTGYCAQLRDATDFASGIMKFFMLTSSEREAVSVRCRKLAMDTTSYEACSHSIDKLFEMP